MSSREFLTYDCTPGLSYRDRRDKHEDLWCYSKSEFDDNWGSVNACTKTNSFHMPHIYNIGGDMESEYDWYHITGGRKGFKDSNSNVSKGEYEKYGLKGNWPGKNIKTIYGSGHVYRTTMPEVNMHDDGKYKPWSATSLQLYSDYQMQNEQAGFYMGSEYVSEAMKTRARWVTPIGIQFKWQKLLQNQDAMGDLLWGMWLVFTNNWAPNSRIYAPIVERTPDADGFSNPKSYYRGYDWVGNRAGSCSKGGEIVGWISENAQDVLMDKYTQSALIGICIIVDKDAYEGASRRMVTNFWDFKLLFNDEVKESRSRIVLPEPHYLEEHMQGKVKLL